MATGFHQSQLPFASSCSSPDTPLPLSPDFSTDRWIHTTDPDTLIEIAHELPTEVFNRLSDPNQHTRIQEQIELSYQVQNHDYDHYYMTIEFGLRRLLILGLAPQATGEHRKRFAQEFIELMSYIYQLSDRKEKLRVNHRAATVAQDENEEKIRLVLFDFYCHPDGKPLSIEQRNDLAAILGWANINSPNIPTPSQRITAIMHYLANIDCPRDLIPNSCRQRLTTILHIVRMVDPNLLGGSAKLIKHMATIQAS